MAEACGRACVWAFAGLRWATPRILAYVRVRVARAANWRYEGRKLDSVRYPSLPGDPESINAVKSEFRLGGVEKHICDRYLAYDIHRELRSAFEI